MKNLFKSKPFYAIALGLGIASISSSAFAATPCPFPTNNGTLSYQLIQPSVVKNLGQFLKQQNGSNQAPTNWKLPAVNCPIQPTWYASNPVNTTPSYPYFVTKPVQQPVNNKPVTIPTAQPVQPKPATPTNQSSGTPQATQQPEDAVVNEVVKLVNQERAKAGLQPLELDKALSAMAHDKAVDMNNNRYFDHNSPTYGSPFDMMNKYGIRYTYAGENIAMGQRSAEEVMNQWMNSDGHRKNILNPNFTKIGVAHYNGYWVQEFIRSL